jgi:hypothetical protein
MGRASAAGYHALAAVVSAAFTYLALIGLDR